MPCSGHVGSITIAPNKTMRIIATIIGPVKRFVDMEVLVTEMDGVHCPIDPQVWHLLSLELGERRGGNNFLF